MVIPFICLVASVYIGHKITENNWGRGFVDYMFWLLFSTGVFILLCGLVVTPIAYLNDSGEYEVIDTQEIVSLSTKQSLSGNFVLGSGSVKNKPTYFFYAKEGNFLKLENVRCEDTLLNESDDESPSFKRLLIVPKYLWLNPALRDRQYILTIPKNSVIKEFNPNL